MKQYSNETINSMDTLIETFHLDLKLLIAQIVNFAIVFWVLYRFAFKPLLKTIDERNSKIEKGLSDAESFEKKLQAAEDNYNKKIDGSKVEARKIVEEASQKNEIKRKESLEKTREEIGVVINQEKEKMQIEKEKTLKEIKSEISDLVLASVEKVLDAKLGGEAEKKLIQKSIKENLK